MDSSHHLTIHPDLGAVQAKDDVRSVTLLGYILDPNVPNATDEEIIRRLLANLMRSGWKSLIEATVDLGGRWILIVNDGSRLRLLTDPCGYRQVVFTHSRSGQGLWCASQPGLLAELLRLEPSAEALDFIKLFRASVQGWRGAEYWWPGDTTEYREIRHLLPNHYLDLNAGEVHRFWPEMELARLPVQEAVERNARLLLGIIESASRRFDLALALTAGRDTRLLLAGTRPLADKVFYFTLKYWDINDESVDVVVTRKLKARLGLDHRVIQCPAVMEPWFEQLYKRNVSMAHEVYGTIAQGLWNDYPQDRLCMKGTASSVMHNFDRFRSTHPNGRSVRTEDLVRFAKIVEHPFAIRAIKRWLSDARSSTRNFDLIDLFYWETKEGNWQAMSQLEWDIVQEVLVPFNCRSFMSNALSVDSRFRSGPTYLFQRMLTSTLWPEVLTEPVNSISWPGGRVRRGLRDFLVRRGLYKHVRRVRSFSIAPANGRKRSNRGGS